MHYFYLSLAIFFEIIGTFALKETDGFKKIWPIIAVIMGYGISFIFLSMVLQRIPVGVAYAIWSGVGIILITLIGIWRYNQTPDLAALIGLCLIVTGVVVLRGFSSMT